uniref:Rho-GAP domain-containing protein n=1 Tax=Scophthalmus maximus TaxID=52904 RepID=A0A8D3DUT1_SCOMX
MRRVRRRGGNKEKVFGCDLLEHLTASSQEIPQVLRCCSEFVERHGVVDGIYRLSGVSSNIQKLRCLPVQSLLQRAAEPSAYISAV